MKPYFTIMISWSDREPRELGLYLTSDSRLNIYEVWFTESTHVCKKEHRIELIYTQGCKQQLDHINYHSPRNRNSIIGDIKIDCETRLG